MNLRRILRTAFYCVAPAILLVAQEPPRLRPVPKIDLNMKTGPAIGTRIPDFRTQDQNGNVQTFDTLRGPKGLVLLFVRSADWCPFCKAQLVELQQQNQSYRKHGLGVAALTYDSAALLRQFAQRKGISYPLLADLESKVIRAFGILNTNFQPGELPYGAPFPGMYIIDEKGVVQAKYFEDDHTERYTAASILVRRFADPEGLPRTTSETKQLTLTSSASDAAVPPGSRVTLILDVDLRPGMHLYAPGIQGGYISLDWQIAAAADPVPRAWLAHPAAYPPSRMLNLPVIGETVPVYQGHIRLLRDLTIGSNQDLKALPGPDRALTVAGSFRYQACDDRMCYPPRTVPLQWTFRIQPLDSQRAPAELQRK